jgi:hypothetical protein
MNAHLPRTLTRKEMRQRGVNWLWGHPRPETVTPAQLISIGLRADDAEDVVREARAGMGQLSEGETM